MVAQRVLNFFKIVRDVKLESKLQREGRDEELDGLINEGFFFRPADTLVPNYLDQQRRPLARSRAALALPDATSSPRFRSVSENTVDIQRLKQLLHGPEQEIVTAIPATRNSEQKVPNLRSALTSHPVQVEDLQVVGLGLAHLSPLINPNPALPISGSSASNDPCHRRSQSTSLDQITSNLESPSQETSPSKSSQESFPQTIYKSRPASKSAPVLSVLTGEGTQVSDIHSSPLEISTDLIDTLALMAGMTRYKRKASQRLDTNIKGNETSNERVNGNEEIEIYEVAVLKKGVQCLLNGVTPVKRVLIEA